MVKLLGYLKIVFVFIALVRAENLAVHAQSLDAILPVFDEYVKGAMEEWKVPGAAVAIVKDGKIVFLKEYGTKEWGKNDPVALTTVFPIVSLTKTFTATLMAKMVDLGLLKWDDKVKTYFPEFKLNDSAITNEFTIRDLLSHRSGLPAYTADSLTELGWSEADILAALPKIPLLEGQFRKIYEYQNVFVGIAGYIIEKIMNKPLSEVYNELLFKPLGLKNTFIGNNGLTGGEGGLMRLKKWLFSPSAHGTKLHDYREFDPRVLPGGNPAIYTFVSSRGIHSTIEDMAKWLSFQLNNGITEQGQWISAEAIADLRKPHVQVGSPKGGHLFPKERVAQIAYGMGWYIYDYSGVEVLGHMGGMTGVRSIFAMIPSQKIGIVVLANLGGMRVSYFPEALRSFFFDLYLGIKDKHDWSHELYKEKKDYYQKVSSQRLHQQMLNPQPAAPYSAYVGDYENDLYGVVRIVQENEKLVLYYKTLKVVLTHWNGDNFSFTGSDLSPGLAAVDKGDLIFGFNPQSPKAFGCMINLFREGKDSLFNRIS